MKKLFNHLVLILLSVLCFGMVGCSSDDDAAPQLSVPAGFENFFMKSMDFDSSAGEKTFTFNSNVTWTLSVAETRNGSSWLSVNPAGGDAGTHTVTVKALENTTYDNRNAVITISAGDSIRKVFVNQKQLNSLTLTSNRFEVPVEGGTIEIGVKSNVEYEVVIPDEYKSWIHIVNNQTRSLLTTSFSLLIDRCDEYDKREGTIVVRGDDKAETITIFQAGEGILTLTQNEYNLGSYAQELTIEVNSNFEYGVEFPNVDWLQEITAQTRGVSTHTLRLLVKENDSYDGRSAKIRLFDRNSAISEEIVINQSQKDAIIIDPKEYVIDERGGAFSVEVNSNVQYQVIIVCDWIKEETATTRGLVSSNHTFNVSAITDNKDRQGTITFYDTVTKTKEIVVVKQKRSLFFGSNTYVMIEGTEQKLDLTNTTDQSVTWNSSNPSVASVDNEGLVKALLKGNITVTATTEDGQHVGKCDVIVEKISDCVSMIRTGTSSMISPWGSRYGVTFKITNSSPETIHLVSLAGVTDGMSQDLGGGESVEITLSSSSPSIQNNQQTLVFTFNGKQYSING